MAVYVKVNDAQYAASITGRLNDKDWNNRASKAITIEMSYADAINIFVDGVSWSIVQENLIQHNEIDENGEVKLVEEVEIESHDNSEYCIAGSITDHRDGTITVKMGQYTNEELLLMEVLA